MDTYANQDEISEALSPHLPKDYGLTQGAIVAVPTLRDRLKKRIENNDQEKRRVRKMNKLYDLLAKNPEVAEILELIEELRDV